MARYADVGQYQLNKQAKVGTTIICPSCGRSFKKRSYQQAFCSNKGKNNCKDSYHNRATEKRLARAIAFQSNSLTRDTWDDPWDDGDPWHEPDFNPLTGD